MKPFLTLSSSALAASFALSVLPSPAKALTVSHASHAVASNLKESPNRTVEHVESEEKSAEIFSDATGKSAQNASFSLDGASSEKHAAIAEKLTLQGAIETALAYNSDSKIADHQSRAARAEALSARASLLPQVDFNAGYGLNFDVPYGRKNDFYQGFNASVSASQLIYDFGKFKARWKAAQARTNASENTQLTTRQTVILDVRNAFFDVLEAQALVAVGEQTLDNDLKHLEQTQALVDVGTRPTIDLVKLKSEVASAKASLVQAKGNERIARAQLSFLIGRPIPPEVDIVEPNLGRLSLETKAIGALYEKSLESRPEFQSQKAAIQAQALTLDSLTANLLPTLYAVAEAGWNWRHISESNLNFNVGLRLSWNLFDGLSNKGATSAAQENLAVERLRLTHQEQKVFKAIEAASLNLEATVATLEALDEAVQASGELLASAEERYAAGVGNVIELTDAQFGVAEAKSRRVRGHYDVLAARAALLNAVGIENWE